MAQDVGERQARVGAGVYGGLFFTTLSTLTYEILLTRIFSVTMWYHFAFVAVSLALFGMTAGALLVHLLPQRFPPELTKRYLFYSTLLFSLTIVVSFILHLQIPFDPGWSFQSVALVSLTYLVISIPFVFSGITVCLALTRFPQQVSRLYAVDLVGAALGTITLIWLLDLLKDGPSAVLAVAGIAAVAAALFAYREVGPQGAIAAVVVALALGGFAVTNAVSVQQHNPILRITQVKGQEEDVPLYETWNAFSRIRVTGDLDLRFPLGPEYPGETIGTLGLTIDATAGATLTAYDGDPASLAYMEEEVVNLVHFLRDEANVLIMGIGGGWDVLSALHFEQREITAVEMNGAMLDTLNDRYGDYTGHLDEQSDVTFVNDEARSYVARSDDKFDIIQIPFTDTWAATAAGAFALTENSLYTIEAWESFLEHLTDGGILSVTRWYFVPRPMEAYRLTSLAVEALRGAGIENPRAHIILARSAESLPDIAQTTILVSPQPFSAQDLARARDAADAQDFQLLLTSEDNSDDPLFALIAESDDPGSIDLGFPGDISAPTDDRPFFFQMIGFTDLFDSSLYGGFNDYLARPVLVLFSLAVAVLLLTALCIMLPLLLTTSRKSLEGMLPFVVFFAAIGLGFLLLEIAQLQRLTIFLGHPTYALSVVLFSLLLFSGIGSLATERLAGISRNPGLSPTIILPLVALLIVVVTFGFATPGIIDVFDAETTPVRIAAAVGILAPMGLVMGVPFPLGMKVAALRPNAPTAFFWGINGATSVSASVLAVAVSMGWGISMAFWAGCLAYLIAGLAMGVVIMRERV